MNLMKWISDRLQRKQDGEGGFTLIELMVVVLIIAILIAIAIPTFLGARERAQDRAAQSSLRNTVTAAKVIFTDSEDYADADVTAMEAAEPSLSFVTTASTGQNEVSIDNSGASQFGAAALSNSGKCFFIKDDTQGPGTTFGVEDPSSTCTGTNALSVATDDSW